MADAIFPRGFSIHGILLCFLKKLVELLDLGSEERQD